MNANQINLTLLLLCYVASGQPVPNDADVATKLNSIAADGSNLLAVCASILRSPEGSRHQAILNGLIANAAQQVATLKGLLA